MDIIYQPTKTVKRKPAPTPSYLTNEQVQDIIACAVYAATVGAKGMELHMLKSQWSQRGQRLFDLAMSGAKQGQEWAL